MEELYKENILNHYRNPHNKGELLSFTFMGEGKNASCGDEIFFYVKLDNDEKVEDVKFFGNGCAISQASASMLTDKIIGLEFSQIKSLTPGDIYNMLGIKISQGRVNCALLSYEALNRGVKNFELSKNEK